MEDPEDPIVDEKQPTVTEELLQIFEDFGDYIEKFMFEIVTFLAVIDSSMGLIKDVLSMFGFSGWKLTFFPSFSFAVTVGVFLFGTKKRKGKRDAEAADLGGLGDALEMLDDVIEVVDEVAGELEGGEDDDDDEGGLGLGEYGGGGDSEGEEGDVQVGARTAGDEGEEKTNEDAQQDASAGVATNQSAVRKAIRLIVVVVGLLSRLTKKERKDESEETPPDEILHENQETKLDNESSTATGGSGPPDVNKSKLINHQESKHNNGITFVEAKAELRNEAEELITAVRADTVAAGNVIKNRSLETGNAIQHTTGQMLNVTGALDVGRGLAREVDFIGGKLNKEATSVVEAAEKGTLTQVGQLKRNPALDATGVLQISNGLYREVDFISGKLAQEAASGIGVSENSIVPEVVTRTFASPSSSTSYPWKLDPARTEEVIQGEGSSSQKHQEAGEDKGYLFIQGKSSDSNLIPGVSSGIATQAQDAAVNASGISLGNTIHNTHNGASGSAYGSEEIARGLATNSLDIYGIVKTEAVSVKEDLSKGAEEITSELKAGTSEMAGNIMNSGQGVTDTAGDAAKNMNEKAKKGLRETQRKGGGIIQIAVRLVRLLMRIINRKKSGEAASPKKEPSPKKSGVADSGASAGAVKAGGGMDAPQTGARAADGAAGMADLAGSAASALQGGSKAGGIVGVIRTVIGLIVRLGSLLKKSAPPKSDETTENKESKMDVDDESDSEYFDAEQDVPQGTTTDNPTHEERERIVNIDAGSSALTLDGRNPTLPPSRQTDGHNPTPPSTLQTDGHNPTPPYSNVPTATSPPSEAINESSRVVSNYSEKYDKSGSKHLPGQSEDRFKDFSKGAEGLSVDVGHNPSRVQSSKSQRITLKISGGNSESRNTDSNSIFIDIDAPVVLHSVKGPRNPAGDQGNPAGVQENPTGDRGNPAGDEGIHNEQVLSAAAYKTAPNNLAIQESIKQETRESEVRSFQEKNFQETPSSIERIEEPVIEETRVSSLSSFQDTFNGYYGTTGFAEKGESSQRLLDLWASSHSLIPYSSSSDENYEPTPRKQPLEVRFDCGEGERRVIRNSKSLEILEPTGLKGTDLNLTSYSNEFEIDHGPSSRISCPLPKRRALGGKEGERRVIRNSKSLGILEPTGLKGTDFNLSSYSNECEIDHGPSNQMSYPLPKRRALGGKETMKSRLQKLEKDMTPTGAASNSGFEPHGDDTALTGRPRAHEAIVGKRQSMRSRLHQLENYSRESSETSLIAVETKSAFQPENVTHFGTRGAIRGSIEDVSKGTTSRGDLSRVREYKNSGFQHLDDIYPQNVDRMTAEREKQRSGSKPQSSRQSEPRRQAISRILNQLEREPSGVTKSKAVITHDSKTTARPTHHSKTTATPTYYSKTTAAPTHKPKTTARSTHDLKTTARPTHYSNTTATPTYDSKTTAALISELRTRGDQSLDSPIKGLEAIRDLLQQLERNPKSSARNRVPGFHSRSERLAKKKRDHHFDHHLDT